MIIKYHLIIKCSNIHVRFQQPSLVSPLTTPFAQAAQLETTARQGWPGALASAADKKDGIRTTNGL